MRQCRINHSDEESIVIFSNTVIDPNAVMIKIMNTSFIAITVPITFLAVSRCIENVAMTMVTIKTI